MSLINIDGINLYYVKQGKSKKTVLLLHGWGQNSEMMSLIADYLKKHFTVYNFDLPGFGKSDDPITAFTVEDYADLIFKFTQKKKINNPIIIGHSFGCRIAIRYAYKYDVNKMVLTGAAGIKDKRGLSYYFKVYSYKLAKKTLNIGPLKKYRDRLIQNAGSADYRSSSGIMRETFVKVVNDDIKDILKDIDVETLLVFGENDVDTPVYKGKMMEQLMPDAALVIFENDDHYAYYHQADRFNLVLDAFLRRDYDD